MTVAVGTISHETNTFTTGRTTLDEFETAADEVLFDSFGAGRSLDGIATTLREAGVSIRPTVGAATLPDATVSADAFDWMRRELLDRVNPTLDGVCLDLHGSMYVEDEPDPEGALLTAVREAVGPDVPITAALDMHATITERMVGHLDGVAGYRTAPHTDEFETGERAAELLLSALDGSATLALGWERLPLLLAGERSETEAEPMASLVDTLDDVEERTGILDANLFLGFPWADSPHAGCHALVTGDADHRNRVDAVATELAERFWTRRTEFDFTTEAYPPSEALDVAAAESSRPVVVAETGDIPGAGGRENLTTFLERIRDRDDLGTPVVAIVVDAESYAHITDAGEGAHVDLALGRRLDGTGLPISGTVAVLRRGESEDANVARIDLGDATVVVADDRTNLHREPAFFETVGIDPSARDVVVLKSGYLSPAWKDVAARREFALTNGDTNQRLDALPYERIPRPIYPIDDKASWGDRDD